MMSDPVTNAEVEDVLSSIRRLVSDDKRAAPSRPAGKGTDRLVLTPALRIEPRVSSDRPAATPNASMAGEEHSVGGDAGRDGDLDNRNTGLDKHTVDAEDDYGSDPYNFYDDDDDADGDREGEMSFLSEEDETFPETPEELAEQHKATQTNLARLLDEVPSESGSKLDTSFETLDSDVAEEEEDRNPAARPIFRHSRINERPPAKPSPAIESSETDDFADDTPGEENSIDADDRAVQLSAKIAQLETAIGNISDNWEPDGASDDDYSGTDAPAMAWEDDPETDAVEHIGRRLDVDYGDAPEADVLSEQDGEKKSFGSATSNFARVTGAFASHPPERDRTPIDQQEVDRTSRDDLTADETLLDEEMLRDLVSEIVRQELQGALGERITRNVRKLVRREIHRALSAQDLE